VTLVDTTPRFEILALDLYRDVHKGIRAELFGVTLAAGHDDPFDRAARSALAERVTALAGLLESHAHHEDVAIEPALQVHLPAAAERIAADHARLEARFANVVELAATLPSAPHGDERRRAQQLHLELAAFTGTYLEHQDLEERSVMPALFGAVGLEAVAAMETAIVSSIPPDEMARSLALMLPAMNVADRAEMLAGMREGAPAEVFEGVLALAQSVLAPADAESLLARLGEA
jgi:Hemerythrin HHE cation binding domain